MTEGIDTYTLENFEGPLDLLWHLINRQEIDIYQVSILDITQQYLSTYKEFFAGLDRGAEFIGLAASLIWFKSKALLPKHEQQEEQNQEEELDPQFDIIHQLLDYCRFKQVAKELSEREQQQGSFYPRGIEGSEAEKNLGIAHLSLDDLAELFQQILAKASPRKGTIQEEEWNVGDKIRYLCQWLVKQKKIEFITVFDPSMGRIELIVTFLALLEMMKSGDAHVVNDLKHNTIYIAAGI
ncbi:MAG TPA: segregation/condensation protein A, partial [Parachlamydiaceae bacterium]|nr:segregation/condensation protein A [Parachlamydiaceae bacterium]